MAQMSLGKGRRYDRQVDHPMAHKPFYKRLGTSKFTNRDRDWQSLIEIRGQLFNLLWRSHKSFGVGENAEDQFIHGGAIGWQDVAISTFFLRDPGPSRTQWRDMLQFNR